MTTGRPCRYCVAYLGDAAEDICDPDHLNESMVALAVAMARMFQGTKTPTDEQVSWFMEDAEVWSDFTPIPERWRLRKLPTTDGDGFLARFRINDVTYVIEDGEGPCHPVRLSTLRQWQRDAEAGIS